MNQKNEPDFILTTSGDNEDYTGYLQLPGHPKGTKAVKTLRLQDLYEYEGGPDVYLDFDRENRIIGIEFA